MDTRITHDLFAVGMTIARELHEPMILWSSPCAAVVLSRVDDRHAQLAIAARPQGQGFVSLGMRYRATAERVQKMVALYTEIAQNLDGIIREQHLFVGYDLELSTVRDGKAFWKGGRRLPPAFGPRVARAKAAALAKARIAHTARPAREWYEHLGNDSYAAAHEAYKKLLLIEMIDDHPELSVDELMIEVEQRAISA